MVHSHELNGETVYLVQPQHIGCAWTQETKVFRSSVWNSQGELISAGFPKFTNWGEKPEVFPVPTSLKGASVMEKLDGSLLIVSKYKGQFILRTRGTVDATKLDNGCELETFKKNHPNVFMFQPDFETWPFSLLFEWTSPFNQIVLNYGDEPKWYFIGIVNHDNYSLWHQDWLPSLAENFGCERPATYTFGSVKDLMATVEQWKGKEGVCVYSNNGQSIFKIKSLDYLAKHRMKDELGNFDRVVDLWIILGRPDFQKFYSEIEETFKFDFEKMSQIQGDISRICELSKEVEKIIDHMRGFVVTVKTLPTRKDQAQKILSSYGNTNRASFCFKLLDSKPLNNDDYKKLLYQVLKK